MLSNSEDCFFSEDGFYVHTGMQFPSPGASLSMYETQPMISSSFLQLPSEPEPVNASSTQQNHWNSVGTMMFQGPSHVQSRPFMAPFQVKKVCGI